MLRNKLIGSLMLGLTVVGCGQFTNFPAQVKLENTAENIASVTYSVTNEQVTAATQQPKITLRGVPGSVGVTYDRMIVNYLPKGLGLQSEEVALVATIRVPSSHRLDENNKPVPGEASVELPIVSGQIVELGNPLGQNRINTQVSAEVILEGTDDAGWPSSFSLTVPINFVSNEIPR